MKVNGEDFNIKLFEKRLGETIAWCKAKMKADDPKNSLRGLSYNEEIRFINIDSKLRKEILENLSKEREERIREEGIKLVPVIESLREGRLMIFYPDWSLFDGAAEAASYGFFDWDNVPAWDTWVYYTIDTSVSEMQEAHELLLFWIPKELEDCAQGAVEANPEQSIKWAFDVDRALTGLLKSISLLEF